MDFGPLRFTIPLQAEVVLLEIVHHFQSSSENMWLGVQEALVLYQVIGTNPQRNITASRCLMNICFDGLPLQRLGPVHVCDLQTCATKLSSVHRFVGHHMHSSTANLVHFGMSALNTTKVIKNEFNRQTAQQRIWLRARLQTKDGHDSLLKDFAFWSPHLRRVKGDEPGEQDIYCQW